DEKDVAFLQDGIGERGDAAALRAQDGGHYGIAPAQLDEFADRLAEDGRTFHDPRLRHVVLDVYRLLEVTTLALACRNQPVEEDKKDRAGGRHRGSDRHEVEHLERLTGDFGAHPRND